MTSLKEELSGNEEESNISLDEMYPVEQEENQVLSKSSSGKLKVWFLSLGKSKKVLILTLLFTAILLFLGVFILLFKLDSYLFPSSLSGSVSDKDGKAVQGAVVCVEDDCSTSEVNGSYVIGDLRYGKVTVSVAATNFNMKEFSYNLKRGRNNLDVTVEPEGFGSLTGNIDLDLSKYDDLKMLIDGEEISLTENGTFSLSRVAIGERTLKVESSYFLDEEFDITINEGQNNLEELQLTPAADVSGKVVDVYTQKPKPSVLIRYADKEVRSDDKGDFKLSDVEIGQSKIKLSFFLEDYLDKTKSYSLKQGLNNVKDVEMTRRGKVVYVSNRMGNRNVYISNYDGSAEKMLSDNKGDSYSPYLTSDGSTVYFVSTREGIKNDNGGIVALVYSTAASGGAITKVSKTEYSDYGSIGSFSFDSMKRTYTKTIYDYDDDSYTAKLYYGNIDGSDMKNVYSKKDLYIERTIVANNGDFLLFNISSSGNSKVKNGLYYLDPSNMSTRFLWEENDDYSSLYPVAISPSRKFVLVMVWDGKLGRQDLWNVGIFDDVSYRVTNTSVTEQQPRFTPDGSYITYITTRDGEADVYKVGLDGKGETKVSEDGKVSDYSWTSDGIVFYNSDKVMWAIDSTGNVKAQQVTDSVLGAYYGSYYYYGMD
ncbi:MAG: hypothetical protein PHS44_02360 [Candidatus Dojkabacteria bacterium]|nr:hypothetical protein [Candidatus Dojkabacteria bacterium]